MAASAERVAVGRLVGVFGVKGWIKVKSYTEPAENIVSYSPWHLRTAHGLKVVEVDDAAMRPQGLIVHIAGCDDRDEAVALGKCEIEIEKSMLPSLPAGEYYWQELLGLSVDAEFEGETFRLGTVKRMLETGANDVLVVLGDAKSIDQRERLIPYVPGEFVTVVDLDARVMKVSWDPEF